MSTDPSGNEVRSSRVNVFPAVGAVVLAFAASQGYVVIEQLRASSRLRQFEANAITVRDRLAPLLADVEKKQPEIAADQQMAVDLTRSLVKVAEAGNETAKALLPAIQHDLQQLQLTIRLQADDPSNPAGAAKE